jgi:hypothetical protein
LFSLNSEYICLIITMQILLFSCIHDVNFKHVPYLYTVNYVVITGGEIYNDFSYLITVSHNFTNVLFCTW